jgi:hypothetical protein
VAPFLSSANQFLDLIAEEYNYFALLNFGPLVGVPSLMSLRMTLNILSAFDPRSRCRMPVSHWGGPLCCWSSDWGSPPLSLADWAAGKPGDRGADPGAALPGKSGDT